MILDAPPAPLEWHPAYREHTDLIDWLEGRGPYAEKNMMVVPVPIRVETLATGPSGDFYLAETIEIMAVHKIMCVGLAPYTGPPAYYWWEAAYDNAGRWIAGDAHLRLFPAGLDPRDRERR